LRIAAGLCSSTYKASFLVRARRGGAAEGNARTAASIVVGQRRQPRDRAWCVAHRFLPSRRVCDEKRRISHAVGAYSYAARGADPEAVRQWRGVGVRSRFATEESVRKGRGTR